MSKHDAAQEEYRKAYAKIEKLAAPVRAWHAELDQVNAEIPALEGQRIAALTNGDDQAAEELGAVIHAKQSRAADLVKMCAARESEIRAALEQLARVESVNVARAAFEDATAEKIAAKNEIEKLAPAWSRAQHAYQAAQATEATIASYEADALNIQNQRRLVDQHMALLRGEAVDDPYTPQWLGNGGQHE